MSQEQAPATRPDRALVAASVALALAVLCAGWSASSSSVRNRNAELLSWGPAEVPAQNVVVLPQGSVQSGLREVMGIVTGVRVTGELLPVGPQNARVTQLAPRQLWRRASSGNAVEAAVTAAGNAAAQAGAAAQSESATLAATVQSAQAASLTATTDAFKGGVWDEAQAAANSKARISRLVSRQGSVETLGSVETQLGTQEAMLGTRVSQEGVEEATLGTEVSKEGVDDTALTSVVKHNRMAINDLTEKLKRQKLIDEGQYGILYRRLTAVAERLRNVDSDGEQSKKTLLRAQATLHQGNQMLAVARQTWQPVQGPPSPQQQPPYHASTPQYLQPQAQYQQPQYQQQLAPALHQKPYAEQAPQADAMTRNAWRSSNPVFHSNPDGDWGGLGKASALKARPLSRKQQVHEVMQVFICTYVHVHTVHMYMYTHTHTHTHQHTYIYTHKCIHTHTRTYTRICTQYTRKYVCG